MMLVAEAPLRVCRPYNLALARLSEIGISMALTETVLTLMGQDR